MDGASCVGDRRSRLQSRRGEAVDESAQQFILAAVKGVGTGRLDDKPVWRIGSYNRRETQCADRQPVEGVNIILRVGFKDGETRHQRLCLGCGLLGVFAVRNERLRVLVEG